MSQDQTNAQDQQAEEGAVEATLKFGETYVYKGITFIRDKPVVISQEDADFLAETAIDTITVSRGGEKTNSEQSKFEFRPAGSAAPAPKARGRSR